MRRQSVPLLTPVVGLLLLPHPFLQAQESTPAELYEQTSAAVVQVFTQYHESTGFLVEPGNYVLTTAQVVKKSSNAWIRLDSVTKVRGIVAARRPSKNLAILEITDQETRNRVPLSFPSGDSPNLASGDEVVVLGFSFLKGPVLHTGHASFVSGDNFFTNIQANRRVLGAPILNTNGEVIGISSFMIPPDGGPKNIGGFPADAGRSLVQEAVSTADQRVSPNDRTYPVIPLTPAVGRFTSEREWPEDHYEISDEPMQQVHHFEVELFTPPYLYHLAEDDPTHIVDMVRWQLEGGTYPKAVILRVIPSLTPDLAAIVGNVAAAWAAAEYANTQLREPLFEIIEIESEIERVHVTQSGRTVQPMRVQYDLVQFKDKVTNIVYLVLSPYLFAPESTGSSDLVVSVTKKEMGHSTRIERFRIPEETQQRIWSDFQELIQ